MTDDELTPVEVRQAISDVRWAYCDTVVDRRSTRYGDGVTREQIDAWHQDAVDRWNDMYPALRQLWRAIDEGRVTIEPAKEPAR
jgi:hypothetical protein